MDEERIIEQGQRLSEELTNERQRARGDRWRCPLALRSRIVVYASACSADGESHQRIADRIGVTQRTLSRWIRRAGQAGAGVRPVAIVLSTRCQATPPAARTPLRPLTPHGFAVEGLDPELLVSLLQVLG